jgi:hypothetical protein
MNPLQRLQLRVLAVLAAMTVGWLYLPGLFGSKEDGEIGILAGIEPSMVLGLSLHTTSHQIEWVREGSVWHLQAPTHGLADQGRVNGIVADLFNIKAQPVVGMAPASANIGLVRLALELEGEPPRVLLFGRKSPVGDGRYVSVGSVVHLTTTPLPHALLNPNAELRSQETISGEAETWSAQNPGLPDSTSGLTPGGENEPPQ